MMILNILYIINITSTKYVLDSVIIYCKEYIFFVLFFSFVILSTNIINLMFIMFLLITNLLYTIHTS